VAHLAVAHDAIARDAVARDAIARDAAARDAMATNAATGRAPVGKRARVRAIPSNAAATNAAPPHAKAGNAVAGNAVAGGRAAGRVATTNSPATDVAPAPNSDPPISTLRDGSRRLRFLAPGAIFLGIRGLGLLIFWWFSNANTMHFSLNRWDAGWYLAVARYGYLGVPKDMLDLYGHHTVTTPMVFFPGYPQLVRWSAVLFGHSYSVAGVVVSIVAGVAAAYGVDRLARRYTGSRRTGLVMVVLFAAAPMSIVYSMAYPEALLCAFAAWALVGLSERRWGLAGICTAAAGYVSPMAAPLILAVVAVAVIDLARKRARWDALAAILLAPAGMAGYLLWIASVTGRLDGYFVVQKQGWGSGFDFGWATAQWFVHTWSGDRAVFTVLTTWIVLAAVVLLAIGATRQRMPWQLWLFSFLVLVFIIGSSGVQWDKVRLLLVAFPLLLPIANVVGGRRPAAPPQPTGGGDTPPHDDDLAPGRIRVRRPVVRRLQPDRVAVLHVAHDRGSARINCRSWSNSSARLVAPSFCRIRATWCSTVLAEMNNRSPTCL
jgi:hypothetical protein